MLSYGLEPHGHGMTRVTANSSTQIDNIFSNLPLNIITFENHITDISYHYGQILNINMPVSKKVMYIKKRFYNSSNISRFQSLLAEESWHDVLISQNTNDKCNCFVRILGIILMYHFRSALIGLKKEKIG